MGLALTHLWINLKEVSSISELKDTLKKYVRGKPKGSWILGRGWDHEKFQERRYPTRLDLDEVSKEHFIVIIRVCGHLCVVNTRVLELLSKKLHLVGDVDLSQGIIKGNLIKELFKLIPSPTFEEIKECMKRSLEELVKAGITTVHAMSVTGEEMEMLQQLRSNNLLSLRVRLYVHYSLIDELERLRIQRGFGDDFLKIMGVKIVIDGSLGARTAALEEPYSDDPENTGLLYMSYNELVKILDKCKRMNLQPSIHVIGDKAVRLALKAIREIYGNDISEHRPRLEHASLMPSELIERAKELNGLVISIQPSFVISDFWAVDRVGRSRAKFLYPFNSLLSSGIRLIIGSDSPVENFDPMYQIYAVVTRGRYEGIETYKYTCGQEIEVADAIKMYTLNGAYATFEEKFAGSISPGKRADFVILSKNPLSATSLEIRNIKVLATIVNGNFVYESPEFREVIREYEV